MKILNFSVNNYRCITGGLALNTVNFDDSNTIFIFGQNNSGKSSFLRAYKLFYEDDKVEKSDFYNELEKNNIEIEIEVLLSDEEKGELKGKKTQAETKYFYGDNKNILKLRKVWDSAGTDANNLTFLPEASDFVDVGFAGVGEHNVFKKLLPTPIFIEAMPDEQKLEEIVTDILAIRIKELSKNKEDVEYKKVVSAISDYQKLVYASEQIEDYKKEVNKNFGAMFPDIQVNIKEKDVDISKAIAKTFTIAFDHLNPDKTVKKGIPNKFDNIGHGAIRIALFSLLLVKDLAQQTEKKNGKNYIVLFEEPELFLHPKLTKELRELIYEVSRDETPFQVLCASHSSQMIDLTKPKTSIVRMVKTIDQTRLYQVGDDIFLNKKAEVKQEIYEILRFNPYICESFYADEVVLIEGDAEALVLRGYLQEKTTPKSIFVVTCGTVNNIPFFQKVFSKFNITYHLIFDTDNNINYPLKLDGPSKGIQKSIIDKYNEDKSSKDYKVGLIFTHHPTFEPAHQDTSIPEKLRYPFPTVNEKGEIVITDKPFKANEYWRSNLLPNLDTENIDLVPIIKAIKEILEFH